MICLPTPDKEVLKRRPSIIRALRAIVPGEGVIETPEQCAVYETDAFTAYRQLPLVVVLPTTVQQVSEILAYCHAERLPVVPRGAGTSLSGGAIPLGGAVVLGMAKFKRIKQIDLANRTVTVEPGVTNLAITEAVSAQGFYFAPDPSSQVACTIGGNVAENSGGVHCLKYGVTSNNVLGMEVVLMNGDIVRLGGQYMDSAGYDLLGLMTGSEGLLGVVTEVTVRILPKPAQARALLLGFKSCERAGECVGAIIGAGVIPAAIEMMDRAAIHATEAFVHVGYPLDVEALLIVEVDGCEAEVDDLERRLSILAATHDAVYCRASATEAERVAFWAGRKAAFPAVAKLSPDYLCMDGTIPRRRLPEVLSRIKVLSSHYELRVVNVFHAGDGNLHPMILFDAQVPGELDAALDFGSEILKLCVEVGGVLTGEHGVGLEKRDLMGYQFNEVDLAVQRALKEAFDPHFLFNPGKVFPILHRCAEQGRLHVHDGALPFPHLPRF